MESFVVGLLIGVALGSAFWIGCLRRSCKNPKGTTAKLMTMVGGGGPDPSAP